VNGCLLDGRTPRSRLLRAEGKPDLHRRAAPRLALHPDPAPVGRDDAVDGALADPQFPGHIAERQAVRLSGDEAQNLKRFSDDRRLVIISHCSP